MSLIALGVTGGIGAYKAVEVARGLQKRGHDVVGRHDPERAALRRAPDLRSDHAAPGHHQPVDARASTPMSNTSRSRRASNLLLVVPATANIIGKFANGIADDFLSAMFLATRAPVLLAPSMNTNMLENPAVTHNLQVLSSRGVLMVEPGAGYLACGWVGKGRLAEPDEIVDAADRLVRPAKTLAGVTAIVTAGPTYEAIDPVRFLGNRSSGRMGFELAAEAERRGAHVVLVAGPTSVPAPVVSELVRVRTAAEMHDAVMASVYRRRSGHHGGCRGRLHAGAALRTQDQEERPEPGR